MNTPRINRAAPMTRDLVARGALAETPLVLVDVGVSGGIADYWRAFGSSLAGYGFDPLVRECERLNREERNPRVRYYDGFVGFDRYGELFPPEAASDPVRGWSNQPFERCSAARAQRLQATTVAQRYNYDNPDVVLSERRVSLDAFFRGEAGVRVDVVKVDTDGHDYEVLCGARELLATHQVLGLLVECQFHGVSHEHSNLFANIDRLARENGFSLFDLEIYRYTRGVLPGHFEYNLAAQTREGQVLAGDALYLRDVPAPGYEQRWGALPREKVLKLACLFEIFGMPDCAVELLLMKRQELQARVPVAEYLDLLAREIHPKAASLDEINRTFERSTEAFYPQAPKERLRRFLPRPVKRILSGLRRRLLG